MSFDSETVQATVEETATHQSGVHRVSVRAARAERREATMCLAGLDAVGEAKGELDLELRLAATVFGMRGYASLPRYRRQYVLGYVHGAKDALARKAGRPVSIVPPPDKSVPAHIQALQVNATWHKHPHGGGWVASTAYVALTAYVGPGAIIMERARVLGMARVYGGAMVCEDAEMFDTAQAHGRAVVAGTAVLMGTARIAGDDFVSEGSHTAGKVVTP